MIKTLITSILLLSLSLLTSCEEKLTPNEETEKILINSPWKLQSVKIDGVTSNLYSKLQLTFTKGGYAAINGGDIFGSSGIWEFNGTDGKVITIGGDLDVQLISISSTNLTISFFWDKTILTKGRVESLKGDHQMSFVKQ